MTGEADPVVTQQEVPVNRKRHLLRTVLTVALAVTIIVGIFYATTSIIQVPQNSAAIRKTCEAQNAAVKKVNGKFAQLNALFDQSAASQGGIPPELQDAYDAFKEPIPLTKCS